MKINDFISNEFGGYLNKLYKEYTKYIEQEYFKHAKETKVIEEAVLIMHPKHKHIIMESELSKATILWSEAAEEDKAYMIVDENLKEAARIMKKGE